MGIPAPTVDHIRAEYIACDRDRSGTVDLEELIVLVSKIMGGRMGPNLVRTYATLHFNASDKDKSGSIDFDEFLDIYSKLEKEGKK